jgi:hypothetical protein
VSTHIDAQFAAAQARVLGAIGSTR